MNRYPSTRSAPPALRGATLRPNEGMLDSARLILEPVHQDAPSQ
jgi:hypothetical protein